MFKIAIDAGHGLKTAGKQTPNGIKEWSLNDAVRDRIVEKLSGYNCEIINTDNDEGNTDESLSSRLNKYLAAKVDLFVSIHHNAFTGVWNNATGVEVYTDNNPTAADIRLAELIYQRLVTYTGLRGRGVKKSAFYVINQNKIPAVLCEGGFMDSTRDYEVITSAEGQDAYARAVAEGIIEFLGLTAKAEPTTPAQPASAPAPTAKPDVIYQIWDDIQNRWLPNVKNTEDYAGLFGHDVCAVFANASSGNLRYKVHIKGGGWLPEVLNRTDYAGLYNRPIDGFMIRTDVGSIRYRVHLRRTNRWLPWVTGYSEKDKNNGYAGILGQEIDAVQIEFV